MGKCQKNESLHKLIKHFCPQVHKKINANLFVEPDAVKACMNSLRPYHSLLLLQGSHRCRQNGRAPLFVEYNFFQFHTG